MIVEWFLDLCAGLLGWLADAFGLWTPPSQLMDASVRVNDLLSRMAGLGNWVEWNVLGACVSVQLGVWGTVLGIKLVRAIVAHVPGFGGAGD